MISKIDKNQDRLKRHKRIRKKISGTSECPRLSVYRSLNHIYAQIIDDTNGNTLVACSTMEKALTEAIKDKSKSEVATVVGKELAKKALAKGINKVVFDRGGYLYIGRVKALADGAREAGLEF
ncbi:MAG: 50S ribosomal protein L18 [Christensenellaceae bacterium]